MGHIEYIDIICSLDFRTMESGFLIPDYMGEHRIWEVDNIGKPIKSSGEIPSETANIAIAAIAAAAGWNFNQSKNEVELSDLALANVEALARNEDSGEKLYESYCSRAGTQCRASAVTGPTCPYKWNCP